MSVCMLRLIDGRSMHNTIYVIHGPHGHCRTNKQTFEQCRFDSRIHTESMQSETSILKYAPEPTIIVEMFVSVCDLHQVRLELTDVMTATVPKISNMSNV